MDALELLKQVEATKDLKKHQQLFEQIKTELQIHTHTEETVLYPAFEKHEERKDITHEAFEEHKQIKILIREIAALGKGSERFDAKLIVMGENVEHHVKEEETEMFPEAKKLFDRAQIEQLGQNLEAAKIQFGKATQKRATTR